MFTLSSRISPLPAPPGVCLCVQSTAGAGNDVSAVSGRERADSDATDEGRERSDSDATIGSADTVTEVDGAVDAPDNDESAEDVCPERDQLDGVVPLQTTAGAPLSWRAYIKDKHGPLVS